MSFENLFSSIEQGDLAAVDRLLLADPRSIEAKNAEGLSPLIVAVYWRQPAVLDRLLEAVADLDFWEAATIGDTGRVSELVRDQPGIVASRSPDGFTALHLAAFFGHTETVRILIDAGADVSARTTNALVNQPIHAAAAGPSALECVRLLVEAGADVNERQSGGFTPLMSVARGGDVAVIDLLLAGGADPALEDDEGLSAAAHASGGGHVDIATRLRALTAGGPAPG